MTMTVIRVAAVLLAIDEVASAALNFTIPSQVIALTLAFVAVAAAAPILGSLYLIPRVRSPTLRRIVLGLYVVVIPLKALGLVRFLLGTPNLGEGGVQALILSWLGAILMLVAVIGTRPTTTSSSVPVA